MASTDTSVLRSVLSRYVLWDVDNSRALQFAGNCLVRRLRHCLQGARQWRGQVSRVLEGAGGLHAVPGGFCTCAVFPGAQSEAGTEEEQPRWRGFRIARPPIVSNGATGHWSFDYELS